MAHQIDTTVPLPFETAQNPEVVNHTPWPSQNFQHIAPDGELLHVVVTRQMYTLVGMDYSAALLPEPKPLLPKQQGELVEEDQYYGRVNASSVLQESDYAPYKPLCDVILANAIAHAPEGKAMSRWAAGFRFGDAITKKLHVTGPRCFSRTIGSLGTLQLSEPRPVKSVPLCYEYAYGGPNVVAHWDAATTAEEESRIPAYYEPNPIGCGRLGGSDTQAWIEAQRDVLKRQAEPLRPTSGFDTENLYLAPQIEVFDEPFDGQRDYPVVGVGAVGRWWRERYKYTGTHDQKWLETQWPKSPKNHDYRYWNCAPEDQQIAYPAGGEEIVLVNLTPRAAPDGGPIRFALPKQPLKVLARLQAGPMLFIPMNIDTIIIDFAKATLAVVSRALIPTDLEVRKLEIGTWDSEEGIMEIEGTKLSSQSAERVTAVATQRMRSVHETQAIARTNVKK